METSPTATGPQLPRTPSDNRRRGNRHRLNVPATLVADGSNGETVPVVVTAFSVNGVGIRIAQPLAVGDCYALSSFDTLLPPGLRVRVRSQRITPAGDHEVGAEVI